MTKEIEGEGIWRGLDMKVQDSSYCKFVFLTMECQQLLVVSLVGGCPILRILAPDNSKLVILEDPKTSLLYIVSSPLGWSNESQGTVNLKFIFMRYTSHPPNDETVPGVLNEIGG